MSRTILFVPSNPSHVKTQLPVAEELLSRGHRVVFLSRDSLIEEEYRIEPSLEGKDIPVIRYDLYYDSDEDRYFPKVASYLKFKTRFSRWLADVGADAAVVCNDDAALFDRVVVDLFHCPGKHAFLIQESVRPALRWVPLVHKVREQGGKAVLYQHFVDLVFRLQFGPFFRKGYAHSNCSQIFTAGNMFRTRLLKDGIADSRVKVTGQPRLDAIQKTGSGSRGENSGDHKVLLFCNQPVKCSMKTQEQLFLDLVDIIDAMNDVKLIFKLHPVDPPESYWMKLLGPGQGRALLEVTQRRTLPSCFESADAVMTIASTTCLEAMDFGLPVGLIDYLPIEWNLPYSSFDGVISIQSKHELPEIIRLLLFDELVRNRLRSGAEKILREELFLRDGKSAWRIANHIEECLTK